jgi:acyl-CoA hydrolase
MRTEPTVAKELNMKIVNFVPMACRTTPEIMHEHAAPSDIALTTMPNWVFVIQNV